MTVQTHTPTPLDTDRYPALCARYDTDSALLSDPVQAAPVRAFLDYVDSSIGGLDGDLVGLFTPYTPVPEPVAVEPEPTRPSLAVVPNVASVPTTPAYQPTPGTTPWLDRFASVHPDAPAALTPVQLKALVVIIRMRTDTLDDYIDPYAVCHQAGVGLVTEKVDVDEKTTIRTVLDANGCARVKSTITLRRWLSPGGALYPFMRLKGTAADRRYLSWTKDDRERWRLDAAPLPTACHFPRRSDVDNDEGYTVFVKAPHNWLWVDPTLTDGDHWVSRGVSDDALWGAVVCVKEAKGREGFRRAIAATDRRETPPTGTYLAEDYNVSPRAMFQRLAAAEDAGLVKVNDRTGNRHAAYRMPQMVTAKTTTTASRARLPRIVNEDVVEVPDDMGEPPF